MRSGRSIVVPFAPTPVPPSGTVEVDLSSTNPAPGKRYVASSLSDLSERRPTKNYLTFTLECPSDEPEWDAVAKKCLPKPTPPQNPSNCPTTATRIGPDESPGPICVFPYTVRFQNKVSLNGETEPGPFFRYGYERCVFEANAAIGVGMAVQPGGVEQQPYVFDTRYPNTRCWVYRGCGEPGGGCPAWARPPPDVYFYWFERVAP